MTNGDKVSFEKLEKPVLLKVAEAFGVEVNGNSKEPKIIEALAADGVTWEMACTQVPELAEVAPTVNEEVKKEEEAKKEAAPKQLIRMIRDNFRYDERGYTFTKAAPFNLVTEEEAEWFIANVEGFRYATPKEVAEFYG